MSAIELTEQYDLHKLRKLTTFKHEREEELKLDKLLKAVSKNNGILKVDYKFDNRLKTKGVCMSNLSRKSRSFLLKSENITDLDMTCCNLYILKNITKLNNFNKFQIEFITKLINIHKEILEKIGEDYYNSKQKLISWINGGVKPDAITDNENYTYKTIADKIVKLPQYKEITKINTTENFKITGKKLSRVIYYEEYNLIQSALEYFNSNDLSVESIIFDGVHIRGIISEDQIKNLQNFIQEQTNFETKWVVKPFEEYTFESKAVPSNEPEGTMEDLDIIIFKKFTEWTKQNKLMRLKSKEIVLNRVNEYHAEVIYKTAKDAVIAFIEVSDCNNLFKNLKLTNCTKMLREFIIQSIPDKDFPVVERSMNHYGYRDGIYDITNNQFIMQDFPEGILCRKYFDYDFENITEIDPILFRVLKDQGWENETIEVYCALLGRSFFRINFYDKFGVVVCSLGVSSTGKSTTIETVAKCMNDVTTLDTKNSSFILAGVDTSELLIINEAENLPRALDVEQIKSMARGEITKLNKKYENQFDTNWDTPMLFATNDTISYKDNSGAIANRIIYFVYPNIVKPDPTLKEHLLNNSHKLLPFFINSYHNYLKKHNNKLVLTPQITDWNDGVHTEDNYFQSWLNSTCDNLYWQVIYSEGEEVSTHDLTNKWNCHWKFGLGKKTEPPKIGINKVAMLAQLGIEKKRVMVCKFCENRHKVGCCDKYDRTKRTSKLTYINCSFLAGKLNRRYCEEQGAVIED